MKLSNAINKTIFYTKYTNIITISNAKRNVKNLFSVLTGFYIVQNNMSESWYRTTGAGSCVMYYAVRNPSKTIIQETFRIPLKVI